MFYSIGKIIHVINYMAGERKKMYCMYQSHWIFLSRSPSKLVARNNFVCICFDQQWQRMFWCFGPTKKNTIVVGRKERRQNIFVLELQPFANHFKVKFSICYQCSMGDLEGQCWLFRTKNAISFIIRAYGNSLPAMWSLQCAVYCKYK